MISYCLETLGTSYTDNDMAKVGRLLQNDLLKMNEDYEYWSIMVKDHLLRGVNNIKKLTIILQGKIYSQKKLLHHL